MDEQTLKEQYKKLSQKKTIDELEISFFLTDLSEYICKEVFGFKEHPIVFFDEIEADYMAMFNPLTKSIIINKQYLSELNQAITSTLHEAEHFFQLIYVKNYQTEKSQRWKKELENYKLSSSANYEEYISQEIEIDAIAFSQVFSSCIFDFKTKLGNTDLQFIIEAYIYLGKMLEE